MQVLPYEQSIGWLHWTFIVCFLVLRHTSLQMLVLLLLAMARGDMVKGKAWKHFGLLNELRAEGSWFRWLGGSFVSVRNFFARQLWTSMDSADSTGSTDSIITLLKWSHTSQIERVQDSADVWTSVLNIISQTLFDKASAVRKLLQFLSIPQHKNSLPALMNFGRSLVMSKWPRDYGLSW